jgi:hypothetical protein
MLIYWHGAEGPVPGARACQSLAEAPRRGTGGSLTRWALDGGGRGKAPMLHRALTKRTQPGGGRAVGATVGPANGCGGWAGRSCPGVAESGKANSGQGDPGNGGAFHVERRVGRHSLYSHRSGRGRSGAVDSRGACVRRRPADRAVFDRYTAQFYIASFARRIGAGGCRAARGLCRGSGPITSGSDHRREFRSHAAAFPRMLLPLLRRDDRPGQWLRTAEVI